MYIRRLIRRNFAELAEAVPIVVYVCWLKILSNALGHLFCIKTGIFTFISVIFSNTEKEREKKKIIKKYTFGMVSSNELRKQMCSFNTYNFLKEKHST